MKALILAVAFLIGSAAFGQSMRVKVVDHQDSEQNYDYVYANKYYAVGGSLNLRGATLTLVLPDGRIAVVNCESKFAEHFAGRAGNRRSCRIPLVDELQAEFKGDNAKLSWSVSIDGSKMQSETYKIIAVYPAPVAASLKSFSQAQPPNSAHAQRTTTTAAAPTKSYQDICKPPVGDEPFGHCDMTGYHVSVPFRTTDDGSVYIQTSVGGRYLAPALLDTGASSVNVNDMPSSDELKGATSTKVTTADGRAITVVQNSDVVCIAVNKNVWLCEKTDTTFSGASSSLLLGNSFTQAFTFCAINRRDSELVFSGLMPGWNAMLIVDGKLYKLDNF